MLDEQDCLLLYRFTVPGRDLRVWQPPGGGIEPGESALGALARELTYVEFDLGEAPPGLLLPAFSFAYELSNP